MHVIEVIRRDVLSKFTGEVLSRALFLLFFFYVARMLGATDFGVLNLAISTTYILGVLCLDPGLNLSTVQILAGDPSDSHERVAGTVLCMKFLLFIPFLLVLLALSRAFGSRLPSLPVLLSASMFALLTAVFEYLCSLTNAYHRMDLEAGLKIFNRLCIVLLGLFALAVGRVNAVLLAMWSATFLSCVMAFFVLRSKLLRIKFHWNRRVAGHVLKAGLPIAGTLIVGTIYLKWDLLVLSYFNIGKQQIGWYAGAFKIVEALSALPTLLGAALFPIIVQLRAQNPSVLDRLLLATVKTVLLFSIPIAAAISISSSRIIGLVYGQSYVPGATVLAVLIWCIVPIFVYFYLMFVNVAAGYAKANLLAGSVALVVGLLANVTLVPRIGYVGAAWSALAANSCFAILATWKVCTLFANARIPGMLAKLLVAGLLMGAVGLYAPVSLSVQLGLGLLVYVVALLLSRAIGPEDFSLLARMLQARIQPQTQT